MKASLILFTLSLSIGANGTYAKQAKHGDDEAGGPQATQAMHHDEAGTVTYRGQLGGSGGEIFSLKIGPVHEAKSWVAVYVGANGCLGDMAGQATVRGDVLELTKDDGGNDCRLTIHRSATGATIVENNCTFDHGMSCSFDTQGKTLHQVSVAKAPVAEHDESSPAHAEKIDLLCTNNGGAGREDAVTFDAAARTLTWAQNPESPLHIKSIQKTKTGYVLRLPPDSTTNSEVVVYINGKESRLEVHNGNYIEKDPCHVIIGNLRKPTNAESASKAPVAAAPLVQDRVNQSGWTFHAANGGANVNGVADDGYSSIVIGCIGEHHSVSFVFYLDGYHGHALNKVKDIKQPFVVEIQRASGDNRKFSTFLYMTPADGGWVQEESWSFTGGEATGFLDTFGQDGRLSLQTGKGVEVASWTLKGTSPIRESIRETCNL